SISERAFYLHAIPERSRVAGTRDEGAAVSKLCYILALAVVVAAGFREAAAQQRPTRFWNLTKNTISQFYLAPAGTSDWGPNQCQNDKDGRVDFDERLALPDVPAGVYDAKFSKTTGPHWNI